MFDTDKEGGYGWFVTLASALLHAVVGGIAYSCGVINLIFGNYFNHPSHFVTSWISSALLATCVLAGIPGTVLTYKFGYRPTIILGGLLAAGGMTASIFSTEYYQVLLAFGVLTGFGFGLALTPSVMIIESYFFIKRPFAVSIAVSGSGAGLTLIPVAAYYLEQEIAWKGLAWICVGLCLNICMCGVAMRPSYRQTSAERRPLLKIFESGLCQSGALVSLCIVNFLWSFGSVIIYSYLPGYAVYSGQDLEFGVILIGIVGLSSFVSRPVFQLFTSSARLDNTSIIVCSLGMSAIMTGLHTELFTYKAGQIGYCIVFGLHAGFWTTFIAFLTTEMLSDELAAYGRGFVTVCVGLGLVGGGPLAGWVLDEMDEDYEIIFYLAGACLVLSSGILAIVNIKKCYFRPMADFCDSDSESSGAKRRTTCIPEEMALMATESQFQEGKEREDLTTAAVDDEADTDRVDSLSDSHRYTPSGSPSLQEGSPADGSDDNDDVIAMQIEQMTTGATLADRTRTTTDTQTDSSGHVTNEKTTQTMNFDLSPPMANGHIANGYGTDVESESNKELELKNGGIAAAPNGKPELLLRFSSVSNNPSSLVLMGNGSTGTDYLHFRLSAIENSQESHV